MTLNIWNLSGPWRQRREEICVWIERLHPDVVCLQEVVEAGDGRNTASWLAASPQLSALGYAATMGPGLGLDGAGWFGNAVLSRHEVSASQVVPLPALEHEDEGRVLLHVRTAGVDVFCTHLNWQYHHADVRRAQVLEIDTAVKRLADGASPMPPVLAGDFNAEPMSDEIRFLTGDAVLDGRSTYFQDAWRVAGGAGPGWTWDNRNPFAAHEHEPDRRIDYVLVGWRREGGAGRVESARVVCDRALTGTYATDHYGLVADLAGP
jgi:endonuclease/exonuclease/phosphatase family metal-dependent hydrolase